MRTFHEAMDAERKYQLDKWGNEFDSKNTANDWIAYIVCYLGKAVTMPWDATEFCKMLVKTATLCMAAYEWCHRGMPKRHYDE